MELSRRGFLKSSAAGLGAIAGAGMLTKAAVSAKAAEAASAEADAEPAAEAAPQEWPEVEPYTGTPLAFHHVCLTYEDIDAAIHLWCDVLGFELNYRGIVPDPEVLADNTHMADSYEGEDHYESETVTIGIGGQMVVELQRPIVPAIHTKPARENGYNYTGIMEIAFQVDDIDWWHQRIVDAGYRPQSDPWQSTPYGSRTFVFYDHEGNIIQLWQEGDLEAFIAAMSAEGAAASEDAPKSE